MVRGTPGQSFPPNASPNKIGSETVQPAKVRVEKRRVGSGRSARVATSKQNKTKNRFFLFAIFIPTRTQKNPCFPGCTKPHRPRLALPPVSDTAYHFLRRGLGIGLKCCCLQTTFFLRCQRGADPLLPCRPRTRFALACANPCGYRAAGGRGPLLGCLSGVACGGSDKDRVFFLSIFFLLGFVRPCRPRPADCLGSGTVFYDVPTGTMRWADAVRLRLAFGRKGARTY